MRNSTLLFSSLIMVWTVCISVSAPSANAQQTALTAGYTTIELRQVLFQLAEKYDCQFTIEASVSHGDIDRSIERIEISKQMLTFITTEAGSLNESLKSLREISPNVTFSWSKSNRKVVHIIDARLKGKKGYAVEEIIDQLNFSGDPIHFIDAIRKKGILLSSHGGMDTRELQLIDFSTKIKVRTTNKSVREVLTDALHQKNRGRILWIAETDYLNGGESNVRILR